MTFARSLAVDKNNFAKIIYSTDGRQVLAYVQEWVDGHPEVQLVIRTHINGQQYQLTFRYLGDTAWNLAYTSLARFDVAMADKVERQFVENMQENSCALLATLL
jgi:hypothetical protein